MRAGYGCWPGFGGGVSVVVAGGGSEVVIAGGAGGCATVVGVGFGADFGGADLVEAGGAGACCVVEADVVVDELLGT